MAEKNTLSILETIKRKMQKLDRKPQKAASKTSDDFDYISSKNEDVQISSEENSLKDSNLPKLENIEAKTPQANDEKQVNSFDDFNLYDLDLDDEKKSLQDPALLKADEQISGNDLENQGDDIDFLEEDHEKETETKDDLDWLGNEIELSDEDENQKKYESFDLKNESEEELNLDEEKTDEDENLDFDEEEQDENDDLNLDEEKEEEDELNLDEEKTDEDENLDFDEEEQDENDDLNLDEEEEEDELNLDEEKTDEDENLDFDEEEQDENDDLNLDEEKEEEDELNLDEEKTDEDENLDFDEEEQDENDDLNLDEEEEEDELNLDEEKTDEDENLDFDEEEQEKEDSQENLEKLLDEVDHDFEKEVMGFDFNKNANPENIQPQISHQILSDQQNNLMKNNEDKEIKQFDAEKKSEAYESTVRQVNDSVKRLIDAKNIVSGISSFSQGSAFGEIAAKLMESKLEKWCNEHLAELVEKIVSEEIKKIIPKE